MMMPMVMSDADGDGDNITKNRNSKQDKTIKKSGRTIILIKGAISVTIHHAHLIINHKLSSISVTNAAIYITGLLPPSLFKVLTRTKQLALFTPVFLAMDLFRSVRT